MADQRAIETRLLALLAMVNDWLKYAETKNSLVVGLASAGLLGTLATLPNTISGSSHYGLAMTFFALGEIVMITSVGLSLVSFLPRTDLEQWVGRRHGKPAGSDNLYFYGHLAKYAPEHLARAIGRRFELSERDANPTPAAVDISAQIITNARITLWKLRLFVPALVAFVTGVMLMSLAVAVGLIWRLPDSEADAGAVVTTLTMMTDVW